MSHPCRNCAFHETSVWQPIAPDEAIALSRHFVRKPLDEGQILFEQGSDNCGVYCVSKGLVALRSRNADGSSTLLRLAYPGDVIGYRSFLGDRVHRTEAQALMPTRICRCGTAGRGSGGASQP